MSPAAGGAGGGVVGIVAVDAPGGGVVGIVAVDGRSPPPAPDVGVAGGGVVGIVATVGEGLLTAVPPDLALLLTLSTPARTAVAVAWASALAASGPDGVLACRSLPRPTSARISTMRNSTAVTMSSASQSGSTRAYSATVIVARAKPMA